MRRGALRGEDDQGVLALAMRVQPSQQTPNAMIHPLNRS
eukprot:COSAG02_NODE_65356_length_258_cov_0.654088_1_plen_38_part_01